MEKIIEPSDAGVYLKHLEIMVAMVGVLWNLQHKAQSSQNVITYYEW